MEGRTSAFLLSADASLLSLPALSSDDDSVFLQERNPPRVAIALISSRSRYV